MNTRETPETPRRAQTTASIIGLSLPVGVTLFALVAFLMHRTGGAPRDIDPEFARVMLYAWIGLTTITSLTALFFWRSRVEPLVHSAQPLPANRMSELTTNLLVCWAVVEASALFGVAIYFLHGVPWVAIVSLVLIWGTYLATRPQLEWYERFRGG